MPSRPLADWNPCKIPGGHTHHAPGDCAHRVSGRRGLCAGALCGFGVLGFRVCVFRLLKQLGFFCQMHPQRTGAMIIQIGSLKVLPKRFNRDSGYGSLVMRKPAE